MDDIHVNTNITKLKNGISEKISNANQRKKNLPFYV